MMGLCKHLSIADPPAGPICIFLSLQRLNQRQQKLLLA